MSITAAISRRKCLFVEDVEDSGRKRSEVFIRRRQRPKAAGKFRSSKKAAEVGRKRFVRRRQRPKAAAKFRSSKKAAGTCRQCLFVEDSGRTPPEVFVHRRSQPKVAGNSHSSRIAAGTCRKCYAVFRCWKDSLDVLGQCCFRIVAVVLFVCCGLSRRFGLYHG